MRATTQDTLIFSGLMFVALSMSVPMWLVLFGAGFNLGTFLNPHFWGWILAVTGLGTVVYWVMKTNR